LDTKAHSKFLTSSGTGDSDSTFPDSDPHQDLIHLDRSCRCPIAFVCIDICIALL